MSNTNSSPLKASTETAIGEHILIDLWTTQHLDDIAYIEDTLKQCVEACQATLLHTHVHQFSPQGGISGVAVLAESHISVHTWPELGYAAFDVFMCGNTQPQKAVEVLKQAFSATDYQVRNIYRGINSNTQKTMNKKPT